jgi:hypothetical protein
MRSTGSGTDRTEQTATVEQRERSGDPWIRSQEFCDTLYLRPNALPFISSGAPQTKEHRVADAMIEAADLC